VSKESEYRGENMIKTPIIIVNYKTYAQAYGRNALELTRKLEKVADGNIAIAPLPMDIPVLVKECSLPVFSQHLDGVGFGSFTGHILPEAVKEAGAIGTLINHSERRLRLADIEASISRAKQVDLATVVCTNNINVSAAAAAMSPDFVAVEPPELIGGDISVSKAQPEIVSGSVEAVKSVNQDVGVLCGAGVKDGEDVRKSIELGSQGVLLASGLVKAKNVETVAMDLLSGL